jgi:hypothetical protein
MTETETTTDLQIARLKRQIKILSIFTLALVIAAIASTFARLSASKGTNSTWPDVSANVLQARRIVLMTNDGRPAAMLGTTSGSPALVLLDDGGDVRVLLSTEGGKGLIALSDKDGGPSTYLRNGILIMGNQKAGGVLVEGPPSGAPFVRVFDSGGYAAQLGQSSVTDRANGAIETTSAAALMGSGPDHASAWSLLSQPTFTPISEPAKNRVH